MAGELPNRDDEELRLTGARNEFVASLPRRLEVLRAALHGLAIAPGDLERLNGLLRRLHALASAATVLGFASVAEALSEAERTLRRAGRSPGQGAAFQGVARALDVLPSLVLGAPFPARVADREPDAAPEARPFPLSVLMFGEDALAGLLRAQDSERIEVERTEDPERARELARTRGPDAAVIDGDLQGARELVESLRADASIDPFPILVIGHFANAEGATGYVALGADRVLPKPVSPEALTRTLIELGGLAVRPGGGREPLGELTVEALAERIGSEIKKGLVESLEASGRSTRIEFGDGADVMGAVWGAVARVRELVTLRSGGNLRFELTGPSGAIPFASWTGGERRVGERGGLPSRSVEDVGLKGRRVVVADDDPAVVWFLGGLLRAVGAEVLEAHDGDQALACVFASWPDLVVSDVLMPGRDGFSLCHEIKRDVAVRDVPVILLSWKEDLLQRVRELGADADGYLRKEMAAGTVVERLREVLRPRARVEQRLSVGGEVRGRLDGITPRLVLELVTRLCPDSTLTIRDAVYLYEVHVRGGRLRSISRSTADGSFERGEPVLSALLGVSAGRFAVLPDTSSTRAEFDAPLRELLDGPVRRARSALAATSAESLQRVNRVDVDLEAMRRYLDCTPENARQLVERLAKGESPRALLAGGAVSPWLLEAVLSDLGRRGAIREVDSQLAPVLEARRVSAPVKSDDAGVRASALESTWSEPSTRDPGWSDTKASAEIVSDGVEPPRSSAADNSGPLLSAGRGYIASSASQGLEAGGTEEPSPNRGDVGFGQGFEDTTGAREMPPVEPSVLAEEASSVATAIEESADPFADFKLSEPPGSAGVTGGSSGLYPALADAGQQSATAAQRPGIRPALRVPETLERASPNMADVFAAALAEGPYSNLEADSRRSGTEPVALEAAPTDAEVAPNQEANGASEPPNTLVSPRARGEAEPSGEQQPAADRAVSTEQAAEPVVAHRATATEHAATEYAAQQVARQAEEAQQVARRAEEAAAARRAEEAAAAVPSETLGPASLGQLEKGAGAEPASSGKPSDSATTAVATEGLAETASGVDLASARREAEAVRVAKQAAKETAEERKSPVIAEATSDESRGTVGRGKKTAPTAKSESPVKTALLAVGAFGAAFVLVRWVVVPALAPSDVNEPAAAVSAGAAPVPIAAPAKLGFPVEVRDEPLAQGTDPGPGKGLIDFSADPGDALYVDGTFVGRGERRLVPVPIGRHEVKILRGELSRTLTVEVAAGRSTRVNAAPPAAVPPSP